MVKTSIERVTDPSRLPEIFQFRAFAWENSPSKETVNTQLFPNGWSDGADKDSLIWYLTDDWNKIVATARLTYFDHPEQTQMIGVDLKDCSLPVTRPFGFFSRLAIHKSHRGQGIAKMFDQLRIDQLKEDGIQFAVIEVNQKRIKPLEKLGFRVLNHVQFNPSPNGDVETLTLMIIEV